MNFTDKLELLAKNNDLASIKKMMRECRNELCFKCRRHRAAHLGACRGCKWSDNEND